MVNFMPQLFAPEAYQSRKKLINAFDQYFSKEGHATASASVKGRYENNKRHELSTIHMARLELVALVGLLSNTAPTFFWLLLHICLDPDLSHDLRDEVGSITFVEKDSSMDDEVYRIDVKNIGKTCPLLVSTYKGILRLRSRTMSSRMVTEDTIIDGHLLRKGTFVQMPSYILHTSTDLWGQQSQNSCPRLFLKVINDNDSAVHDRSGTFRAFGGGQSFCPGRHFATLEIVAAAAMFVARFDLSLGAGIWDPRVAVTSQSLAKTFEMPTGKIRFRMKKRAGYEANAQWKYLTPVTGANFSYPL